jgi:hypothetical protein
VTVAAVARSTRPVSRSFRPPSLRLAAAAVTILGVALFAACGDGEEGASDRGYDRMEQGLGLARERARTADPEGARRAFFDRAHDPLHRLAAEAAERDRASAGQLLEAKQSVERSLAGGSPTLAEDLDRLLAAAADARRVTAGEARPKEGDR